MESMKAVMICALLIAPDVAQAYIGPGAGISAIGTFLALVGALLMAIVGFIWFPLKRLFTRRKNPDVKSATGLVAELGKEDRAKADPGPDMVSEAPDGTPDLGADEAGSASGQRRGRD